jgi:hypothetical protein
MEWEEEEHYPNSSKNCGLHCFQVAIFSLLSLLCKNKKFWEEIIAEFPWYDTDRKENNASNNSSIVACVFAAAVAFLRSRFLATMGDIHICTQTIGSYLWVRRWGGLRCHDIHTKFNDNWFRHSKVYMGDTQTAWSSHKPTFIFSR